MENALYRLFRFNPCVAIHELRLRMRGGRPFLVLFFYTLLAIIPVLVTLGLIALPSSGLHHMMQSEVGLGRVTFTVLGMAQLTLILFVMPVYAAGAITMEHEKRTLEMLRATLLSPSDVVTGKFAVVLAFGAILLLTSVPVAAWCMLLGGLAPREVFLTYSFLFIVAVWASALGIFMSNLFRRSIAAIVATYVVILLWCLGLPIIVGIVGTVLYYPGESYAGFFAVSLLFLIIGTVFGWLVFLVNRWLGDTVLRRRRRWVAGVASALAALVAVWLVFGCLAGALFDVINIDGLEAIYIIVPYGGLALILYSDLADQMLASGSSTLTGDQLQIYVWALSGGIFLIIALFLWVRAVILFGVRQQTT